MYQYLLILVAVATFGSVFTAPSKISDIPQDVQAILPKELRDFLDGLTPKQKADLRNLSQEYWDAPNDEQALEALKTRDPELHAKINALRELFNSKLQSLQPEAKNFMTESIVSIKKLRKSMPHGPEKQKIEDEFKHLLVLYKGLSDDAKKSLNETFPQTMELLDNAKFWAFVESVLHTMNRM